jgi:hypothetical protein
MQQFSTVFRVSIEYNNAPYYVFINFDYFDFNYEVVILFMLKQNNLNHQFAFNSISRGKYLYYFFHTL